MSGPAYLFSGQLALFGERRVVGFGRDDFQVMEIERDLASDIIRRNHYSKKVYAASYIHLSLICSGKLVGVLQFGYAMNPASQGGVVSGTEQDEYLELNRMWLDDVAPRNSESRAISFAIKYIRKAFPKIKWIQSFADERCGLFGTVYQAANFHYCGEHKAKFWELDGIIYHNSLMTRDPSLSPGAAILQRGKTRAVSQELRQFRYIYFMAPRFKSGLKLKIKPYPKPDYAARPVDAPVSNGCEPGATPGGRSMISAEGV